MSHRRYDAVIIGAGAAGMTAAVFAARAGACVCVIEHRSEPGKKILRTGNGKCNITHEGVCAEDYKPDKQREDFLKAALKGFGYEETLEFFETLGIPVRNKGGYIYPYSGTALSVRNALWDEMKRLGVEIMTDTSVRVSAEAQGYAISAQTIIKQDKSNELKESFIFADKLILATGLFAAPKTGSDGTGAELAGKLGLKMVEALPSLVKLKCSNAECKIASGVRHVSKAEIFVADEKQGEDLGEIQFTDDGLSGIPIFNISRIASEALKNGQSVKIALDLLPEISREECIVFIERNADLMRDRKLSSFFGGLLPAKLCSAVCHELGVSADRRVGEVVRDVLKRSMLICKSKAFDVSGVYGFEEAQVCRGGVELSQLDPETMEAFDFPGLYVAGELADIDGPCGGYNLQWAWTSGALAGRAAGGKKPHI